MFRGWLMLRRFLLRFDFTLYRNIIITVTFRQILFRFVRCMIWKSVQMQQAHDQQDQSKDPLRVAVHVRL